jgi:hypothetical protein
MQREYLEQGKVMEQEIEGEIAICKDLVCFFLQALPLYC